MRREQATDQATKQITGGGTADAVVVWFRRDLRLADNPALLAAAGAGGAVIPVFIWDPDPDGSWPTGAAGRWWLERSLNALQGSLRALGSRLILRRGETAAELGRLASETGATQLYTNRLGDPGQRALENRLAQVFAAGGPSGTGGLGIRFFNASLLGEPADFMNRTGLPYRVFTPFYRARLIRGEPAGPQPAPPRLNAPERWPATLTIAQLRITARQNAAGEKGLAEAWCPGEAAAATALAHFLAGPLGRYHADRDRPDLPATSRLSAHLHFGEVGPRQVWDAVRKRAELAGADGWTRGAEAFLRQLIWREFAHHLLHHFPMTVDTPLRESFAHFPWRRGAAAARDLAAWQRGWTGYPIVDAGMRQLAATGWMHNRVRLLAGSFLVKDLLLSWHEGARWFWDHLIDADLANNTLGWQWLAGCGADAAPYFRIFNPVLQGERFDPAGEYVRRWVPELSGMPAAWIHRPWMAPAGVLAAAGVRPGVNYPKPLIDHNAACRRALAALKR